MALLAAALAVAFGTAATAQDAVRENANRTEQDAVRENADRTDRDVARENANRPDTEIARSDVGMQGLEQYLQSNTLRLTNLIGMEIQNRAGDNLGEVQDVLRGTEAGGDLELIVHVGGIGADDKAIALGLDDIQISGDGDELYTNRTREQLAAAPAVALEPRGNLAQLAEREAVDADRDNEAANRAAAERGAAQSTTRAGAAGSMALEQRRLGDLVGANVEGSDGEDVAEVDDIVISTAGADSIRAVLQVGGLAGIGEKRVAVPLSELMVDRSDDGEPTLRIAMDQEALEREPEFDYEEDTEAL